MPAAMPVANPLKRAPSGRERSHRTRQVSARLTCPKTKVWKTGSSQRPSAVAARRKGAVWAALRRPAALHERWISSASSAALTSTQTILSVPSESQVVGMKSRAANGG